MNLYRLFCLFAVLAPGAASAQDWSQFRGSGGQGVTDVRSAPLEWSDDSENIAWKSPIAGLGWSSPVVDGNEIWLTSADEEGLSLRVICLDLKTGKELRNVEVFTRDEPAKVHRKNSHASPTPILEEGRVYVHFGTYGTACLSRQGEVLWTAKFDYNHVHGPGGSPAIAGDVLIVICDGGDVQFVAGLDKNTGKELWRTPRPKNPSRKFAFSTPLVIEVKDQIQAVCPGAGGVSSYDPNTGKQLWRVDYPEGYSVTPRPAFAQGLVFVSSGFNRPTLYAIDPSGRGQITESHVTWSTDRAAPHSPSPLVVGEELYIVSDRGVATCLDAKTGESLWQERIGGNFSASPVFAAGRIYLLSETGETTVIAPGAAYKKLATNKLTGQTLASPAFLEGAMLLRTDTHLVRVNAE